MDMVEVAEVDAAEVRATWGQSSPESMSRDKFVVQSPALEPLESFRRRTFQAHVHYSI